MTNPMMHDENSHKKENKNKKKYSFFSYKSSDPIPYSPSSQIPIGDQYKWQFIRSASQTSATTLQLYVQPRLNAPNKLTSSSILFQEKWRQFNLSPENGDAFHRQNDGYLLSVGEVDTWLQDIIQKYIQATLPAAKPFQKYIQQYFVSADHNRDEIATLMIYPQSSTSEKLSSAIVYFIDIIFSEKEYS